MRVIPVLDLLGGVVVRGVAGKRGEYRPVESRIASSPDALAVARAFRDVFGLTELYVADLDAILDRRPNVALYRALAADGLRALIDCGVRSEPDAEAAFEAGAEAVVAGLETLPGPEVVRRLCARYGSGRIVFSLDLNAGVPLGDVTSWTSSEPLDIAAEAVSAGVRRMIVLDLARVGMDGGLGTLDLCHSLRGRFVELELITGGGIRGDDDLRALTAAPIDAVLVASALHDGRLSRAAIDTCGGAQFAVFAPSPPGLAGGEGRGEGGGVDV